MCRSCKAKVLPRAGHLGRSFGEGVAAAADGGAEPSLGEHGAHQ